MPTKKRIVITVEYAPECDAPSNRDIASVIRESVAQGLLDGLDSLGEVKVRKCRVEIEDITWEGIKVL